MKFKRFLAMVLVFVVTISLFPLVATASAQEQQALRNLVGVWEGRYFANQGETGLTLEVFVESGNYKAIFNFYNLPGRSNAREGSYTMNVSYTQSTGMYSLVGEEWIVHPGGYVFVDLHGTVIGEVFSGSVDQQSGSDHFIFSLVRISGSLDSGATLPPGMEVSYIRTEDDLKAIGGPNSVGKYYVLVNDITITGNWTPIVDFRGTLDGAGKKITFESSRGGNFATAGLFEDIRTGTVVIKNLDVRTPIRASSYSFFGGYNHSGVYGNAPSSSNSRAYAGGLIGIILGGTVRIENCSFEGNVTARSNYYGFDKLDFSLSALSMIFPGWLEAVSLIYSLESALFDGLKDTGSRSYAGGLIGYVGGNATVSIENSYSRGNVYSDAGSWTDLSTLITTTRNLSYSGGLVGWKGSSAKLSVGNCYTTASVEAHGTSAFIRFYDRGHAGGAIGRGNFDSTIGNRYRLNTATLKGHSKNSTGVSSLLSHQQMQNQSSFSGWIFNSGGWSINPVKNNGYPYLWIFDNGYNTEPKKINSTFDDGFAVKQGSGQNITIIIDMNVSQLDSVTVNGITLIQGVHYTVTSGSTIVTLLPDYLDTLGDGFHGLKVAFTDGSYAEEQFLVADSSEDEPPIDSIHIDNTLVYSNGTLLVEEGVLESLALNANRLRVVYVDGNVFEEEGSGTGVTTPNQIFNDSNSSQWARAELSRAFEEDLIPLSLLDPNKDLRLPINRVEFAGVVVKTFESLSGDTLLPVSNNPFTDTWDVDALRAYNAGIMVGVSQNRFDPDTVLTREMAATALSRVYKRWFFPSWSFTNDASFPLQFNQPVLFADDSAISNWAREGVYFMAANGIIQGMGNNIFAPRAITSEEQARGYAVATREQAILIALRMVENLG